MSGSSVRVLGDVLQPVDNRLVHGFYGAYLNAWNRYVADPNLASHNGSLLNALGWLGRKRVARRALGNPTEKEYLKRAVALISRSGRAFVGVEFPHGNPPQTDFSAVTALRLMQASGAPLDVWAAVVYDRAAYLRGDRLHGEELQTLRPLIPNHGLLVADFSGGLDAPPDLTMIPKFTPGNQRPGIAERGVTYRRRTELDIIYRLPRRFDPKRPDPEMIRLIGKEVLPVVYGNSTAVGKPPATKAHSAVGIWGDLLVVGANWRDANWPQSCLCAERSVCLTANALGWPQFDALMLYSAEHMSAQKQQEVPHVCELCLGYAEAMTPVLDNGMLGDMLIISCNDLSPEHWEHTWLRKRLPGKTYNGQERKNGKSPTLPRVLHTATRRPTG